ADIAVVEKNGFLDVRTGMDAHAAADDGAQYGSAGNDASARQNGIHRRTAPPLFIEDEFSRRVGVSGGSEWPLAIVEIQLGRNRAQIHAGFVVSIERTDIAPIGREADGIAGDSVGLKIVGVHFRAA